LFERINGSIKRQIEKVEEMTGNMDPKTNFALIVIQTELERYKFMVRSYLRARIAKASKTAPGPFSIEPTTDQRACCRLTGTRCTTSRATS
jgi:hypothetical protein